MNITKLDTEFKGGGEVLGYSFSRVKESRLGYVYKVTSETNQAHFEVFKRKLTPVCLDFKEKKYSDSEFKEMYPKSKSFGKWAWTTTNLDRAQIILNKIKPKNKANE